MWYNRPGLKLLVKTTNPINLDSFLQEIIRMTFSNSKYIYPTINLLFLYPINIKGDEGGGHLNIDYKIVSPTKFKECFQVHMYTHTTGLYIVLSFSKLGPVRPLRKA